jgi:hypothetical protein
VESRSFADFFYCLPHRSGGSDGANLGGYFSFVSHSPLTPPTFAGLGPADGKAIAEAARLINAAKNPIVLVGMLASRPANAKVLQSFLTNGRLPIVGTFQAAGAVGAPLFDNFGGRVGQIANQRSDRLFDRADLVSKWSKTIASSKLRQRTLCRMQEIGSFK